MGKRRSSRELGIRFLYQVEMNAGDFEDQLAQFWERNPCQKDIQEYTATLVHAFFQNKREIDDCLERLSSHWTLERMGVVDRNLLRLAAGEMIYIRTVPPAVIINEAVEIAKKYGCEESPSFVNGVLDKLKKEIEDGRVSTTPVP
ncbi:MAG: transcription antitermination factor NusB [Nitrospinaceae bacterium]